MMHTWCHMEIISFGNRLKYFIYYMYISNNVEYVNRFVKFVHISLRWLALRRAVVIVSYIVHVWRHGTIIDDRTDKCVARSLKCHMWHFCKHTQTQHTTPSRAFLRDSSPNLNSWNAQRFVRHLSLRRHIYICGTQDYIGWCRVNRAILEFVWFGKRDRIKGFGLTSLFVYVYIYLCIDADYWNRVERSVDSQKHCKGIQRCTGCLGWNKR